MILIASVGRLVDRSKTCRTSPTPVIPTGSSLRPREVEADGEGDAGDVEVGGDVGGGGGVGVGGGAGEGMGAEKGIWTTMSLVKSSSRRGVGGSGGRLRASATLLDSPETCLMSLVY